MRIDITGQAMRLERQIPAAAYLALILVGLCIAGCKSDRPVENTALCMPGGALQGGESKRGEFKNDGLRSICGFQAPEDLVLLPDGSGLLISEFGEAGEAKGQLSLLEFDSEQLFILYDSATANDLAYQSSVWGDFDCEQPTFFSPHGIDLSRRPSGRWQLLVVNHGDREAVEMFELRHSPETGWQLLWRGCVEAQDGALFNDVAATGQGFVATQMMREGSAWGRLQQYFRTTGDSRLWQWSLQTGFSVVPHSEGKLLNGVAVDRAQKYYWVNDTLGNSIRRYSVEQQRFTDTIEVAAPDNSNWAVDNGNLLLVASLQFSYLEQLWCLVRRGEFCSMAFSVLEFDTSTGASRKIFRSDASYFGSGTAAVQHGEHLYIGSYTGDRLLVAPVGYGVND